MKRTIRLKELDPNTLRHLTPAQSYIDASNETLGRGPFRVDVDDHGCLRTGNSPSPDDPAIIVFGGSFVESIYATESNRFLSVAERSLRSAGNRVRILNSGYSGTSTLHILLSVLTKAYPIVGAGGRVVVFVGQTDTAALLETGGFWSSHHRITPVLPGFDSPAPSTLDDGASLAALLNTIIDAARHLQIRLAFGISPYRDADFSNDAYVRRLYKRNRDSFERVVRLRKLVTTTARDVFDSRNIDFFDGIAVTENDSSLFYDELHLNEAGQKLFGEEFAHWLRCHFGYI